MIPLLTLAAGGELPALARDLLIILAAAALVAILSRRLRLALIPVYLITGVLIGPVFNFVSGEQAVASISDVAMILLMFDIGLHLDLKAFRGALGRMIGIGVGSTCLSVAAGWGLAVLFGLERGPALVVAMALSLSSTAVVLRTLQQRRLLRRMSGRLSFSVLVVQDLIVVLMLSSLEPLSHVLAAPGAAAAADASGGMRLEQVAGEILKGVGGVGLLVVLGRVVLPRLFAEAARASTEVMLILAAAIAMGAAALTGWLGFSPELGAFVAGFLLAGTTFRSQIAGQLSPLRDVLLAVFFTSVGLHVAPGVLVDAWWIVLLALPALVAVKTLAIGLTAWAVGTSPRVSATTALWLAQGGEFSLVVLAAAGSINGLITDEVSSIVIAIVVLSLIITPPLISAGERLGEWLLALKTAPWARDRALDEADGDAHPPGGFVVIVGFGPVGRTVAERFEKAGTRFRIVELNAETVRKQRQFGRDTIYGDATNLEVLRAAGVPDADAVILTIPDDAAMVRACRAIRSIAPEVFLAVRATYLSKAMLARAEGANQVVVEEMAAAASMADLVHRQLARLDSGEAGHLMPEADGDKELEVGETPVEPPAGEVGGAAKGKAAGGGVGEVSRRAT